MTLSISQHRADIYQRTGLPAEHASEEVQEKILELEREEALLSQMSPKLLQQAAKVGAAIGRLTSENNYMDLTVNSPRRFLIRARLQLRAFYCGPSLTEQRRLNTVMLSYLTPKHEALVHEWQKCIQRLSEKSLLLDCLRDIAESK